MPEPRTTWGIGSYPEMAERLEAVARQAIEMVEIGPGSGVLDVGCGTGSFARLAAERGAEAVGVDAEPVLLEVARSLDRHGSRWLESDFGALEVDDQAFDIVASLFGVMYAQDHLAAASELARVRAPGGAIVLAAWTPDSFMPAFGRAVGAFLPPPPAGSAPPSRWGTQQGLGEILAHTDLRPDRVEEDELVLRFADTAEATEFMIRTAGHVVAERDRLAAAGEWGLLRSAAEEAVTEYGVDARGEVALPLRYLLALCR